MATFTQNRQTTLAGFIDEYVNRGFGSMNKNDLEVWIFDYLLQGRLTGMSNYEISVELRIPESKGHWCNKKRVGFYNKCCH